MKNALRFLGSSLGVSLFLVGAASAQTTWTNGAQDSSWTNGSNWSAGVPTVSSSATINVQPTDDGIILDAGVPASVGSLAFGSSLTGSVTITRLTPGDTLTINGGITNGTSAISHKFDLPIIAGASATYAGGSGGLTFKSLSVGTNVISTTGTITINTLLSFDLNSTSAYGSIGLVNVTGATIQITVGSGYVAKANDTFDFAPNASSSAFTGAIFNASSLPTLTGGLSWDTSKFLSQGTITVVPEPSTWALFGLSLLFVAIFCRLQPRLRVRRATISVRR